MKILANLSSSCTRRFKESLRNSDEEQVYQILTEVLEDNEMKSS